MLVQFVLIIGFVLILLITWKRYKQKIISFLEALLWSFLWLGAIFIVILPQFTNTIANIFGVGRGADLILYFAISIQFFLIFRLFVQQERLERKITKMIEQIALKDLKKYE